MTTELCYLALSAAVAALLWVPYILNELSQNKITDAVGYPDTPLVFSPWAARLKKAHYNAIENLAPFAALVLVAHVAGVSNEATAVSAATFFWARLVHAGAYTFAIPWLRTLAFAVAWAAMMCIAWQVLMS